MAGVNFERPKQADLTTPQSTIDYFERLLSEMEYVLQNLDEDNMTSHYNETHKEDKRNGRI